MPTKTRPLMLLKWQDEKNPRPITRALAAKTIRGNRKNGARLGVTVKRKNGETYIASRALGIACCIYRNPNPTH